MSGPLVEQRLGDVEEFCGTCEFHRLWTESPWNTLRRQVPPLTGEPCCELVPQLFRLLYHLGGFVVRDRTDLLVHRNIPLFATVVKECNVRLVRAKCELQALEHAHVLVCTLRPVTRDGERRARQLHDCVVSNIETPFWAETRSLTLFDVALSDREQTRDFRLRGLVFSYPPVGQVERQAHVRSR